MDFDIRTAILALAVGNLVFGLILQLFQLGAERSQRIPFLAACKLLQGVGWLLLSGRGSLPDLWSFTVGNSCLLSGIAYECWVMYRIARRPVSRTRHAYSAAGIILVCILATTLTAAGRIVVASFVAVIFYALSGQAMLNRPGEKSLLHGYIGGSAWLLAVVLSVRGLWALVAPENFTLFTGNAIQLITFATFYYLMLTNDVGMLLLAKQIADRELRESEVRFRLAFENSNIGMCLVDTQGKLFRVNRQMSEMFGYSQAELESMTINDIARPEYQDVSPRFIQQAKDGEVDHAEFEKEYIHKQGRSVWGQVASSLVRNTEGEPLYFISHVLDITARRQSEEALRASEARFRSYFELPLIGITITSPNKDWLEVNAKLCDMLGYTKDELMRMTWAELTHPDDLAADLAQFDRVLVGEIEGYDLEKRFIHKDGRVIATHFAIQCVRHPDRSVHYAVALLEDITARQRAEAALRESETRYQDLYENAPDMYLSVEPQTGRILRCNQTTARLTGFDKQDLIGRPVFELYHPACLDAARQAMRHFMTTGEVHDAELQVRRQDGGRIDVSLNVSAVRDATGQIVQSRSSWRDITDRKQAESQREAALKALRTSEERYRSILVASPDDITITDLEGRILMVSPAALTMCGYDRDEEMLGRLLADFIVPEDRDRAASNIGLMFQGVMTGVGEYRGLRADGSTFDMEVNGEFIRDAEGQPTQMVFIARDITERKQAEDALRELNAELQTRNEELDAFAHTVAHDLKNPLGIIMGYAELLAEDATLPADNVQQSLVAISRSGQKAANIIDSLFLLASVRKQDVQVAPLDMAHIIAEVALRLADAIQDSNADLHLPDRASWPVALGYAPWIEEIWVNYLSNAIKYGGPQPRIELDAALLPPRSATARERGQGGGFIRFSVRDYGPGLTPEQQERLFAPFERLGQTRVKGHGLGLSVVRRIAEKLGGQVGVDSQPGQGSTFYFTLPAAPDR